MVTQLSPTLTFTISFGRLHAVIVISDHGKEHEPAMYGSLRLCQRSSSKSNANRTKATTNTGHMLDTQAVVRCFLSIRLLMILQPPLSKHSYQAYFTFPRTAAGIDGA